MREMLIQCFLQKNLNCSHLKIWETWSYTFFSIKWIKFPLKKYERNGLTMFSPKKISVQIEK